MRRRNPNSRFARQMEQDRKNRIARQRAEKERDMAQDTHELKTHPHGFEHVLTRQKTYEIRKHDRDFKVGDWLHLREWCPRAENYSGRSVMVKVLYITYGGSWGLPNYLCVMSIGNLLIKTQRPVSDV